MAARKRQRLIRLAHLAASVLALASLVAWAVAPATVTAGPLRTGTGWLLLPLFALLAAREARRSWPGGRRSPRSSP